MSAQANREIAKKWLDAFNGHNLEKLLNLYDEDALHYSPKLRARQPETNGEVRGRQALHGWWQDAFERLPTLSYSCTTLTANDDRVFMEYIRRVEGDKDMRVAEVLEINGGRIVASRVYHG